MPRVPRVPRLVLPLASAVGARFLEFKGISLSNCRRKRTMKEKIIMVDEYILIDELSRSKM